MAKNDNLITSTLTKCRAYSSIMQSCAALQKGMMASEERLGCKQGTLKVRGKANLRAQIAWNRVTALAGVALCQLHSWKPVFARIVPLSSSSKNSHQPRTPAAILERQLHSSRDHHHLCAFHTLSLVHMCTRTHFSSVCLITQLGVQDDPNLIVCRIKRAPTSSLVDMRTRPPFPGMPGRAVSSLVDKTVPKRWKAAFRISSVQLSGRFVQYRLLMQCSA